MRLLILPIVITLLVNIGLDIYIYRILHSLKHRLFRYAHVIVSVLLTLLLVIAVAMPNRQVGDDGLVSIMWALFTYLTVCLSKYVFLIGRFVAWVFRAKKLVYSLTLPVVLGAMVFALMWHGALVTRTSIDVREVTLEYANLPESFDGYKILQFSDFHVGSYGNDTAFVADVVAKINEIQPDIVAFTGDIVNRHTSELIPFVSTLKAVTAKHGVVSVLGNHDYGDYYNWDTPQDKVENMTLMYELQSQMGWSLLNNAHKKVYCNGDSIVFIGVENWGDPPFPVYGDLNKAYPNNNDSSFKVLLTHNPAHWRAEVVPETNIDLTLCGHTHGMQMVINLFGKRISPAVWRYKDWGGTYVEGDQVMYVNIGIGAVAIPMRLGATPELTLITLKKK